MLKVIFTFFFLLLMLISYGQKKYKLDKDTSKYQTAVVMLLNIGHDSVLIARQHILDHNSIDSTKIERKKRFVDLYGKRADRGVLTIYLTPGTAIFNTNQLLKHFGIQISDMHLPVFIDSAIAAHPDETYFQLSAVRYVRLETEEKTNMRYISIRSMFIIQRSKLTDVYIHGTYAIPETQ